MTHYFIVFIMFIHCLGAFAQGKENIRVYTWWDYISDETKKRLAKHGFELDITVYKTNEAAISRLSSNKDGFDIAIVSNLSLPVLVKTGSIDKFDFRELLKKRSYYSFLRSAPSYCVPYLWATTVYTYDSKNVKTAPTSIDDLVSLKSKGHQIGIIDDMFEFAGRVILDNKGRCEKMPDVRASVFEWLKTCDAGTLLKVHRDLSSKDFISSISNLPEKPNTASYGWHGLAAQLLSERDWFKVSLPKESIVVGNDMACVLNARQSKLSKKRLTQFIGLITNEQSALENSRFSQYFSPFQGDTRGLTKQSAALLKEILEVAQRGAPVVLTPPSEGVHLQLNEWWRPLRYGK